MSIAAPRQARELPPSDLITFGCLKMAYIGHLRERASHKRRQAGELREVAAGLNDDDRDLFLRHADDLEADAVRLEDQASRLAREREGP